MAFARPFGQAPQGASPWTAGMPPGLQGPQASAPQQHQGAPQVPQQMFNQPMGAFDITGGGGFAQAGPAQMAPALGQWAQPMQTMQAPVQFVPNAGPFLQQPMQQRFQPQLQLQQHQQQQQQQRSMHHQRSLSASRVGVNNGSKRFNNNQNHGFGGGQWQPNNRQQHQQQQQNNSNNNNNDQFRRSGNRPQARPQQNQNQQQQKGQPTKANQNSNNDNSSNNNKQQNDQQKQQPNVKKGTVKVTKVAKKLAVAKANKVSNTPADGAQATAAGAQSGQPADKPQSKTAERKQFKLQARKNAESLKLSKMPVIKATKSAGAGKPDATDAGDTPIDQSQLKCVPAVFGFVCKACDVFLRDRFARREHIDSESHMEKFRAFELEQQKSESVVKTESVTAEIKSEPNESAAEVKPEPNESAAAAAAAVLEKSAEVKTEPMSCEEFKAEEVKSEPKIENSEAPPAETAAQVAAP